MHTDASSGSLEESYGDPLHNIQTYTGCVPEHSTLRQHPFIGDPTRHNESPLNNLKQRSRSRKYFADWQFNCQTCINLDLI